MRVRIRLFAGIRDAAGASSLDLDLPERACAGDVWAALARDHPRAAAYRDVALLAVDGAFVAPGAPLRPGAEVALLPPVSGGAGALQEEPLSLADLQARLRADGAGAVVAFLGLVRPTSALAEGAVVERLRFEAYAEMAERGIEAIRREAVEKFGLVDCVVAHRVGTLAAGEPIVGVAAAARHRRAAFEAAAWAMDELKTRVPIWKQEQDRDGATRWVNDPLAGGAPGGG